MVKLQKILFFAIVGFALSSCVTARKVNYMQNPDKYIPSYADTVDFEDYRIRTGDRLYVYVYSLDTATPASARHVAVHRGKVLTGHVKVTTLGVSTSSRISDNDYSDQKNMVMRQVKLYFLRMRKSH